MELLGGATSSRVYAALDPVENVHVCLKIIKNDKDYFDQSLNEIKLLQCAPLPPVLLPILARCLY